MASHRKTAREKLESSHASHGKVCPIPAEMRKSFGHATLVVPAPLDVEREMRSVRRGKLITMSQLRTRLAKAAGADTACPLTTGIFARLSAEAAEEDRTAGMARITPYWRTIKDDGKLNDKFPGGMKAQASLLRAEGFTIQKGRRATTLRVKDFEKSLVAE